MWIHAEECPARKELLPKPENCRCGMPPYFALDVARQYAVDALQAGLEEGHWSPPGETVEDPEG